MREREKEKKSEKRREGKRKDEESRETYKGARARLRDTVGDLKMISTVGQRDEGSLAQRKPEMKMEMPTAMTMQIAQGRRNENEKIANARIE